MRQWMLAVTLLFCGLSLRSKLFPRPRPKQKTVALAMNVMEPSVGSAGNPLAPRPAPRPLALAVVIAVVRKPSGGMLSYVGRSRRTPSSPARTPIWPQFPGPLR